VTAETTAQSAAGGFGYGDLKKVLFEHYWEYYREARVRWTALAASLDHVDAILQDGAARA